MQRSRMLVLLALLLAGCDGGVTVATTSTGAGGSGSTTIGSHVSASAQATTTTNATASAVSSGVGGSAGFPELLDDGPWLVGWSGGLDHFSWMRFTFVDATHGAVDVMDPPMGGPMTPFYPCEGTGTFAVDPSQTAVMLTLPATCNLPPSSLMFFSFMEPPSALFPSSVLGAYMASDTMSVALTGAQFPAGFCDPGFTTCSDPYQ